MSSRVTDTLKKKKKKCRRDLEVAVIEKSANEDIACNISIIQELTFHTPFKVWNVLLKDLIKAEHITGFNPGAKITPILRECLERPVQGQITHFHSSPVEDRKCIATTGVELIRLQHSQLKQQEKPSHRWISSFPDVTDLFSPSVLKCAPCNLTYWRDTFFWPEEGTVCHYLNTLEKVLGTLDNREDVPVSP